MSAVGDGGNVVAGGLVVVVVVGGLVVVVVTGGLVVVVGVGFGPVSKSAKKSSSDFNQFGMLISGICDIDS